MTPAERFLSLLNGRTVDRPPFLPAIYDLKPFLIGSEPSTFGQKKEDIIHALLFEAKELDADALTAGYDIYNVEAEAAGCRVVHNQDYSMPEIAEPLLESIDSTGQLMVPERPAGRMELFIEAADFMLRRLDRTIPVRGGISGPFSMAAKLYDQNNLLMQAITDPGKLEPLMSFCTDTIKTYASGFGDIGAGIVVFDSFVSPPLISPEIYRDLVLPFHRDLFGFIKQLGVQQNALIIGGNTLPIVEYIIQTGARQFLLDYTIPLEETRDILHQYPDLIFRVNLPPAIFAAGRREELVKTIETMLITLRDHRNIIVGTGILSPDIPSINIRHAKEFIVDFFS